MVKIRATFAVLVVGLAIPLLAILRATASQSKTPECEAVGGLIVPIATGGTHCILPGNAKSFKDCGDCPEMVVVPAGSFVMGSPNGEPNRQIDEAQVRASIQSALAVGKFEVTFAEWDACVAAGGCSH